MQSTMQDVPLTVTEIFRRGRRIYGDSQVVTFEGEGSRRASFAEVADRTDRLAAGLRRLGVGPGDRVGTLCWNHQAHLEAYFAVPGLGAVLHTLNLRLYPPQLAFIINHAEDRVIIADASLLPLLTAIRPSLRTVEKIVLVGKGDATGLGEVIGYEELIAGSPPLRAWPELDERQAAAMCYTTGTTGDPRGVVYSHRSIWLHSFAVGHNFRLDDSDRICMIVPMFHVLAWGTPHAAWMGGCDMHLPERFLQPEPLLSFILQERPTFLGGVPTIYQGLLGAALATGADLSFVRLGIGGGAAVPTSLMQAYQRWFPLVQAWGMTETSPIGTVAHPPRGVTEDHPDYWRYRSKTGRIVAGVELRITDPGGDELPWDGESVGEIEVRGPWITASYFGIDASGSFHDGWLRTGDVGSVDARGYVQITDRSKDVIKSGGEWISSVELENHLMAHPAVVDVAVVGIPDQRWQERPLAVVALRPGQPADPEELRQYLAGKVAHFSLPESWAFVTEIPKTSVGKQDKKLIRRMQAEGRLEVQRVSEPREAAGS
ncbi:MAG TPA: fatty acid--CoA ligase [Candidatus Binatia bacterium]|nr:fatty acid--CoA ligase [Candidatus Binatia bacterium]